MLMFLMWLVVFVAGALYLAYHRISLRMVTVAAGGATVRLQPVGQRLAALAVRALGGVHRGCAAQRGRAAHALGHQALPDGVPAHAAHHVGNLARGT